MKVVCDCCYCFVEDDEIGFCVGNEEVYGVFIAFVFMNFLWKEKMRFFLEWNDDIAMLYYEREEEIFMYLWWEVIY